MVEGVVAANLIVAYLVAASANDDRHVRLEMMVSGGYAVSNRWICCVRASICDVYAQPNYKRRRTTDKREE